MINIMSRNLLSHTIPNRHRPKFYSVMATFLQSLDNCIIRADGCTFYERTSSKLLKIMISLLSNQLNHLLYPWPTFMVCTQVEVPDGKSVCPDRPRQKVGMSRPSQTESGMSRPSRTESRYVQTVPDGKCLCPDYRAFMSRLSCVHQTFVRSSDFRAFMSRLFCVHQTFVHSSDFRAFMSRLSCVFPCFQTM